MIIEDCSELDAPQIVIMFDFDKGIGFGSPELAEIIDYAIRLGASYMGAGLFFFPDEAAKTMFFMRWQGV